MLVLSRKIGERILVPHCELAVTVIAVEGKSYGWASLPRSTFPCTGKKSGSRSQRSEVRGQRSELRFLTSDL